MKKFWALVIGLSICLPALAQEKAGRLKGDIADATTQAAITQATIQLFSLPDTAFVQGKVSDNQGHFLFHNLPPKKYLLKISFVGYKPYIHSINLSASHPNMSLGTIALTHDAILLDEAIVVAEAPPVTMIQDTTVFHTSAYRVAEGAMLEELVKKLPGTEVSSDGKITVNGKEIKKIMIDGKEFFSDDTQMTLKNIPAKMIEKVKAYDKKSDMARVTGIDDGEEEAVLDLSVKKGMKQGWFGNFIGGYGSRNRYEAGLMANRFTDHKQVSLISSANNTNNQGFSEFGDAGQGMDGNAGNGINTSQTAGINLTFDRKKAEVGGDIRYGHNRRNAWTKSQTETFLQNGSSYKHGLNTSNQYKHNLSANVRIEWRPDSLTNVIFRPTFSYATTDAVSSGTATTLNNALDSVNYKEAFKQHNSNQIKASGSLQFNRKLPGKKGRNITLRFNYNINNKNTQQWTNSETHFFKNDSTSLQDRFNDGNNHSNSYRMQLTYTEPIFTNRFLLFGYSYQHRNAQNQKYIYQQPDRQSLYPGYRLDSLCNESENQYHTQELQITFRTIRPKYIYNIGFNVEPQKSTTTTRLGPNSKNPLSQLVWNFSPSLDLRLRFSKQEQLRLLYRGKSMAPKTENLQEIIDITDPMNLVYGNPALKPAYISRFLLFYNRYSPKRQQGLMVHLSYHNTLNNTAHRISYDETTGAKITHLVNVNGNWNTYGFLSFNTPFKNRKFTFNTYTNFNFQNLIGFSSLNKNDSQKSRTRNLNLLERIGCNYRNNILDIGMTASVRYGRSHNNTVRESNQETMDYETSAYTNMNLPWGIDLSTDINYNIKQGYGKGFNRNIVLWNAQLSKNFLKNKQATLRIKIYDILHQQSNLTHTITANHIQDTEYNTLNSYLMVHFVYRLNTLNSKSMKGNRHKPGYNPHKRGYSVQSPMPHA